MKISWYGGDIRNSICQGHVNLNRFVKGIRHPSGGALLLLNKISKASASGNKEQKMLLKRSLPYFTPTVIIEKGSRRRYENIREFNPIMVLDFDNEPRAEDLKNYLWENYPEIYCVYISPSGQGVKVLIKIPLVKTVEEYKEYFLGAEHEFSELGIDTLDHCNYNPIQPLYLSHDPDLLYKPNPKTWVKKFIKPDTSQMYVEPPPLNITGDDTVYKSPAYYQRITVEIFVNKMHEIVGEPGHTRMRNAAILLGSRSGAGYISISDAKQLFLYELSINKYLQKNLKGYEKTGLSRIDLGYTNPIYY